MIKKKIKKKIKKAIKCKEYLQSVSLAAIIGLIIVIRANANAKKDYKEDS